ncbi:hypothetical protein BLA39750_02232 [Burkholderia lata]|uniref:Internal virion protein B n=1 Tax=Burkholderia lata (strain ATCC 17760 / DSM 23089 / LMG 22485 / NCIMB 9086 / R18194 / 383) TaxID=482957 RepID=A0A6P2W5L1_BURL3|nr:hypothetical protein [Burkholderia lata]VWC96035.1 hypothetical protein BLA39750_02232 [Burkholderia lata]
MAVPLLVASAAISAIGAVRAGQAQAGAANYNAEVAQQNAGIANAQGAAAADAQWRNAERRIGSSIAAFGGSGVQGSTGSPTDVLADNVQNATLDNLTTQYNYKLRGLGFQDQASLDQSQASNASTASYLSAAGSLIGGAGQAAYMSKSSGGYPIPGYGYGASGIGYGGSPTYGFGGSP